MFANYELLEKVRVGNLGEIYRANDPLTGRTVLLKKMTEKAKGNGNLVKRFQREIRLAAQVSHPNLVATYHAGCVDGVYFLVMENIDGVDLSTKVRKTGPLDVGTAVEYVCQAATGLSYLHGQGVFHRNVKPASLMLDGAGTVHVTNMTLARVDEDADIDTGDTDGLTRQGQLIGTTDYLAPEQALDAHSADHRSDIYSLGCTLHYLLTGKPPYAGQNRAKKVAAHARAPIPSLRESCPDISEKMEQVFQRMLAKLPEERFQSMDEVVTALRQALFGGGDSIAGARKKFPWELAAGFLILGIVAGGLISLVFSVK